MSHDRGCSCGRERWEYDECRDPSCTRRLGIARDPMTGQGDVRGPLPPRMNKALDELRRRAEMGQANARQVGGDHYKTSSGIQHWDLVEDHGLGYLEGCATKYLSRWRKKNGLQDLEKALHYTEKLLELALNGKREPRGWVPMKVLADFASDYNLGLSDIIVVQILCSWRTTDDLKMARDLLQKMVTEAGLDAAKKAS